MSELKDKETIMKEIMETEKYLKIADDVKKEAITKKLMYEENLKEKTEQMKKYDVTPDKIDDKLNELSKEIETTLNEIKEGLPIELLKKWGKI